MKGKQIKFIGTTKNKVAEEEKGTKRKKGKPTHTKRKQKGITGNQKELKGRHLGTRGKQKETKGERRRNEIKSNKEMKTHRNKMKQEEIKGK